MRRSSMVKYDGVLRSSGVAVRERSSYVPIFLSRKRGEFMWLSDNVLNINKLQATTVAI